MNKFSLFASVCLQLLSLISFSQVKKQPAPSQPATKAQAKTPEKKVSDASTPFRKGTWNFSNRSGVFFSHLSTPTPKKKDNSFSFNIDPNYFIFDGIAVGMELRTQSDKRTGPRSEYSSWSAKLALTYGWQINERVGIFARLAAGPGHGTSIFDISTQQNNPKETKTTSFDMKLTLGAPVAIPGNDLIYLTPYVYYDKYKSEVDILDINDRTIFVGFKLETYLGRSVNKEGGKALEEVAYKKGRIFTELNQLGSIRFYKHGQKQGTTLFGDQTYSDIEFSPGGQYYFRDNFAAGVNLNLQKHVFKSPGSIPDKSSSFLFQPVVTAQAPLDGPLHHLFLQAAYGFGLSNSGGIKRSVSEAKIMAGFNCFLTRHLSFTPKIGWNRNATKPRNANSGIPTNLSGLAGEVGIRAWLRR